MLMHRTGGSEGGRWGKGEGDLHSIPVGGGNATNLFFAKDFTKHVLDYLMTARLSSPKVTAGDYKSYCFFSF